MAIYANLWGPMEFEYPGGGSFARATPVSVLRAVDRTAAILYTDKFKTSLDNNPKSTDSLGNLSFWVDPGEYILVPAGSPEFSITIPLHPQEPLGGGSGSGGTYLHTQTTPAALWDINHNLGYVPAGFLVQETTGDTLVLFGVESNNEVHTVISFGAPTGGTARVG